MTIDGHIKGIICYEAHNALFAVGEPWIAVLDLWIAVGDLWIAGL